MTLFEFALSRHTDPETSHESVAALSDVRVSRMMATVLESIERLGGATIEDVAQDTGLSLVSVSPRFRPLARAGKIVDSGRRKYNRSGRKAIIWINTSGDATATSGDATALNDRTAGTIR